MEAGAGPWADPSLLTLIWDYLPNFISGSDLTNLPRRSAVEIMGAPQFALQTQVNQNHIHSGKKGNFLN